MAKKYTVCLDEGQRARLRRMVSTGKGPAREQAHAIGEPTRPWNVVWSAASGFTDLGEGPGAFAINNAGAVVGRRYHPQEGSDAFL